jgi:hypothetical protein
LVAGIDGVEDFVSLFEQVQVGAQELACLLAVPGAALGGEQFLLESGQVVEASGHGKLPWKRTNMPMQGSRK